MTARPVVPLGDPEAYPAPRAAKPFVKSPAFLAIVVLAAAGLGVAAGVGAGTWAASSVGAGCDAVAGACASVRLL